MRHDTEAVNLSTSNPHFEITVYEHSDVATPVSLSNIEQVFTNCQILNLVGIKCCSLVFN